MVWNLSNTKEAFHNNLHLIYWQPIEYKNVRQLSWFLASAPTAHNLLIQYRTETLKNSQEFSSKKIQKLLKCASS